MIYKLNDEKILKDALIVYEKKLLEGLPEEDELRKISFSPKFENKMKVLIKRQKKQAIFIYSRIGKCVASIIIAFIVSFSTIMCVDAIREPFLKYIIQKFEEYSQVYFSSDSNILPDDFKFYSPEFIPNCYETIKQEGSVSLLYNNITYQDSYGHVLSFEQGIATGHTGINTEGIEIEKIYIKNHEAIYWENLGERCVLYTENGYEFFVSCKINITSKEELIRIVESIKPVN